MTTATATPTLLDLRGLPNPEPVLALAQASQRVQPGERLEVLSDDPCAIQDFVRWTSGSDLELVSIDYEPDHVNRFVFHKPEPVSVDSDD